MTIDLRKHFFMTFSALLFLGIVIAKPGSDFSSDSQEKDCKLRKNSKLCEEVKKVLKEKSGISYQY